jgi:hypothetical protein
MAGAAGARLDCSGCRWGQLAGCWECAYELLGFTKCGIFLD